MLFFPFWLFNFYSGYHCLTCLESWIQMFSFHPEYMLLPASTIIVYLRFVQCREEGWHWEIHPPRTERFSKGFKGAKCQRKILRSEAEVLPNASRVKAVYGHSLACEFLHCSLSSLLQVNIKKYIPKVRWILTVLKINTSLIMMRECEITTFPWG